MDQKTETLIMNIDEYRILIAGKTGTGKSSVCNKLLGRGCFSVYEGLDGQTTTAQIERRECGEDTLKIIDTPDLVNCEMSDAEIEAEIIRWLKLADPYPHALIITVRCDIRYTPEEFLVYRTICQRLQRHVARMPSVIVAFTHGESLTTDIPTAVSKAGPNMQSVYRDAQNRYLLFRHQQEDGTPQLERLMGFLKEIDTNHINKGNHSGNLNKFSLVLLLLAVVSFGHWTTRGWSEGNGAGLVLGVGFLSGAAIVFFNARKIRNFFRRFF